MKGLRIHNIVLVLIALVGVFVCTGAVDASSVGLYVPTTSVTIGNSITISVTGNDAIGRVNISSSNSNIASVSNSSLWVEGTANFTITAKAEGTATITISPADMANGAGEDISLPAKTITIYSKAVYVDNRSKNNNLSSITIEGYEIDFNKDNTSYNIDVNYDVSKLNISASTEDNKAALNIENPEELLPGENVIKINVTAENESVKTYEIKVNKAKNPDDVNAKLKSLKVINTNIKNIFSSDIYEYICEDITADVDALVLVYEPEIKDAKIEVLGNEKLKQGINHIIVKVTSKDESQTQEYDIIVFKSNQMAALVQVEDEKNDIISWIKENKIVTLCLLVILILIIVVVILLIKGRKKISESHYEPEEEVRTHRRNPNKSVNLEDNSKVQEKELEEELSEDSYSKEAQDDVESDDISVQEEKDETDIETFEDYIKNSNLEEVIERETSLADELADDNKNCKD